MHDLLLKHGDLYPIGGNNVCRIAYCILRGVGPAVLTRLKGLVQTSNVDDSFWCFPKYKHERLGKTFYSEKTMFAVQWLQMELHRHGEVSPVTGKCHVFMFCNAEALYRDFLIFCSKAKVVEHLKESSFKRLVSGQKPASVLLKNFVWMRGVTQKVCDVCVQLRTERLECTDVQEWSTRRAAHLDMILVERKAYDCLRFSPGRPPRTDIHVLCIPWMRVIQFDTYERYKTQQQVARWSSFHRISLV